MKPRETLFKVKQGGQGGLSNIASVTVPAMFDLEIEATMVGGGDVKGG